MTMSHADNDHVDSDFIKQLQRRADEMHVTGESEIASGKVSERVLRHWKYDNMYVMKLPDDQQRILRVSAEGGTAKIDYCSFRGDRARCVTILERALKALKHPS